MLWQSGSSGQFLGQSLGLSLSWDFTSQQQPEQSFWQWFVSTWSLWQFSLDFRDGSTSEPNSFNWVQDGTFPDQTLDTSHTTVSLFQQDFTDDGLTVFLLQLLDFFGLLWQDFSQSLLQSWFSSSISSQRI